MTKGQDQGRQRIAVAEDTKEIGEWVMGTGGWGRRTDQSRHSTERGD